MKIDNVRCIEGRVFRHDPQPDDPHLETDVGACRECGGTGCEDQDEQIQSMSLFDAARYLRLRRGMSVVESVAYAEVNSVEGTELGRHVFS